MAYLILTNNFAKICEITKYKSVLWHELYADPTGGDFQMELPAGKYLKYIQKGYLVVNTESEKFGIIDTYKVTDSDEDGTIVTVSGYMGESMLMRRIVFPALSVTGTLDEVVGAIVRRHAISPANVHRRIYKLTYITTAAFDAYKVTKQITGDTVADAITAICAPFGCSYKITLNEKLTGFEMQLIAGADRSARQSVNPIVVFSADDYGLAEFSYLTSCRAEATHVICAGEGEGDDRYSVTYPSTSTSATTSLNRREVFLDRRDLSRNQGENGVMSESLYIQKLQVEAAEKLAECSVTEACEGVIRPNRYRLYDDYKAGDVVTVRNEKLGMEYDVRVLGALISYDENGAKDITAEMGNASSVGTITPDSGEPEEPTEDEIGEDVEDPAVDADKISLTEKRVSATFGGGLTYCDANGTATSSGVGVPCARLHIYDDDRWAFIFSANVRHARLTAGTAPEIGTMWISLSTSDYTILGASVRVELDGLTIPIYVINGAGAEQAWLTLTYTATEYSAEDGTQTMTFSTAISDVTKGGVCQIVGTYTHMAGVTSEDQEFIQGAGIEYTNADAATVAAYWPDGLDIATHFQFTNGFVYHAGGTQARYKIVGEIGGVLQTVLVSLEEASKLGVMRADEIVVRAMNAEQKAVFTAGEPVFFGLKTQAKMARNVACAVYDAVHGMPGDWLGDNDTWWYDGDENNFIVKKADIIFKGKHHQIDVNFYPHAVKFNS